MVECAECGALFEAKRRDALVCSDRCRQRRHRRRGGEASPIVARDGAVPVVRRCVDCGRRLPGVEGGVGVSNRCRRCDERRGTIGRDEVIDALRRHAAALGRVPTATEYARLRLRPSMSVIRRRFPSYRAALEAAGLTPPRRSP